MYKLIFIFLFLLVGSVYTFRQIALNETEDQLISKLSGSKLSASLEVVNKNIELESIPSNNVIPLAKVSMPVNEIIQLANTLLEENRGEKNDFSTISSKMNALSPEIYGQFIEEIIASETMDHNLRLEILLAAAMTDQNREKIQEFAETNLATNQFSGSIMEFNMTRGEMRDYVSTNIEELSTVVLSYKILVATYDDNEDALLEYTQKLLEGFSNELIASQIRYSYLEFFPMSHEKFDAKTAQFNTTLARPTPVPDDE